MEGIEGFLITEEEESHFSMSLSMNKLHIFQMKPLTLLLKL